MDGGEILLFCLKKFQSNEEEIDEFHCPIMSYIIIIHWYVMLELFFTNLLERRHLRDKET